MMLFIIYDPFEVSHLAGKMAPPTGDYFTDAMADLEMYLGGFITMELPVRRAAGWGPTLDVALEKAHCNGYDFSFTYPGDDGCAKFTVISIPHEAVFSKELGAWTYNKTLEGRWR